MAAVTDTLTCRVATTADCDALAELINNAYRGPMSFQGWTNEDALIPVPRTSPSTLSKMMTTDGYVFLMFTGTDDHLLKGCLSLLHIAESKSARINMFAVRPDLQARGYGKFVLSTAEKYAADQWNVDSMELFAIHQRPELISFYTRRGYVNMGDCQPFPTLPLGPGCTMRDDLTMCTMRKPLKQE